MREGKKLIAIADDEKEIRDVVSLLLTGEGYAVQTAEDGQCVVDQCSPDIDLYILDVNRPRLSAIMAAAEIRKRYDTPIIFLTALSDEDDKLYGYELGADDYVTKPFTMTVLYAKLAALINRSRGNIRSGDRLVAGEIVVTLSSQQVKVSGKRVELTPKEYALLACLMQNRNIVMSREQLLVKCWGYDYEGESRAVDTHIKRLREKLGDAAGCIKTVIKAGYKLEV